MLLPPFYRALIKICDGQAMIGMVFHAMMWVLIAATYLEVVVSHWCICALLAFIELIVVQRQLSLGSFRPQIPIYCGFQSKGARKVVLITGANTGIGLENAKSLAKLGFHVILACRSVERGNGAMADVLRTARLNPLTNKEGKPVLPSVSLMLVDLANFESVRQFCNAVPMAITLIKTEAFIGRELPTTEEALREAVRHCATLSTPLETDPSNPPGLDLLINNAGLYQMTKRRSKAGFDECLQTNHLGPFLLTELLYPVVRAASEGGRIVLVSSVMHTKRQVRDIAKSLQQSSTNDENCYRLSKLCNVLHAKWLARRSICDGTGRTQPPVLVTTLHPGAVLTDIYRELPLVARVVLNSIMRLVFRSCYEGSWTTLHCAVGPGDFRPLREHKNGTQMVVHGGYYSDCCLREDCVNEVAHNVDAQQAMIDWSAKAVGLPAPWRG